jgi:hypothetical protein
VAGEGKRFSGENENVGPVLTGLARVEPKLFGNVRAYEFAPTTKGEAATQWRVRASDITDIVFPYNRFNRMTRLQELVL